FFISKINSVINTFNSSTSIGAVSKKSEILTLSAVVAIRIVFILNWPRPLNSLILPVNLTTFSGWYISSSSGVAPHSLASISPVLSLKNNVKNCLPLLAIPFLTSLISIKPSYSSLILLSFIPCVILDPPYSLFYHTYCLDKYCIFTSVSSSKCLLHVNNITFCSLLFS